ncbi:MAG: SET domain-containing protein-lysine N-methyltransferase [Phycisphaerales bacterium]
MTPDRGRAVFATRSFRKGECVDRAPVIVGDSDWEELPAWINCFVYSWLDIGGRGGRQAVALGVGSLYNSSLRANLTFRAAETNDAIEFHAARDIECGEELTINYSSEHGEATSKDNSWFVERGIEYIDGP